MTTNKRNETMKQSYARLWKEGKAKILADNGGEDAFPMVIAPGTDGCSFTDIDGKTTYHGNMENPKLTALLEPLRQLASDNHIFTTVANGFNPIHLYSDGSVDACGDIDMIFDTFDDAIEYAKKDKTGTLANMLYDVVNEPIMFGVADNHMSTLLVWQATIDKQCKAGYIRWKNPTR